MPALNHPIDWCCCRVTRNGTTGLDVDVLPEAGVVGAPHNGGVHVSLANIFAHKVNTV